MTHRRLILIRHAKSGWDDPFAEDHDRVLTDRGQIAARKIGAWLAANAYLPDVILSSDAARTRETTARLSMALPAMPQITYVPALYHAAPDTIAEEVAKTDAATVAVVGHNPGIGMLAQLLVSHRPKHHRFSDYPTCATTVIDFDAAHWLKPRQGTCTDFVVPRDLP